MLGFVSHIDDNGDAEGNYTVLSWGRNQKKFDRVVATNQLYNYTMLPVGRFQLQQNDTALLPVYKEKLFHCP